MVDPLAYRERGEGNEHNAAVDGLYATFHPHTLADAARLISNLAGKCVAPDIRVKDQKGNWISPNTIELSRFPSIAIDAWRSDERSDSRGVGSESFSREENQNAHSNFSGDAQANVILFSERKPRSIKRKIPGPWEPFAVHPDLPSTQLLPTTLDADGLPRKSPFSVAHRARVWVGIPPAFWQPMLDMAPRLFSESPGDVLPDADLSSQEAFAQLIRIVGLALEQAPEQCPAGYLKLHLQWIQMHFEDSPCWASVHKTIERFEIRRRLIEL